MRATSALLIVGLGVLLLWLGATGRLQNVADAWYALTGTSAGAPIASNTMSTTAGTNNASPANILAALPRLGLPSLPSLPVLT